MSQTVKCSNIGIFNGEDMKYKSIENEKFGRLTAKTMVGRDKFKIALWECVCDCGNSKVVRLGSLKSGLTRSCGCLNNEVRRSSFLNNTYAKTHGLTKHPLYRTWSTMRQRCSNPRQVKYYLYGAVGITVCDSWNESFVNFLNDMGERPEGHTLDRIDGTKGYFPENCKWSTPSEQNYNRRKYTRKSKYETNQGKINAKSK